MSITILDRFCYLVVVVVVLLCVPLLIIILLAVILIMRLLCWLLIIFLVCRFRLSNLVIFTASSRRHGDVDLNVNR